MEKDILKKIEDEEKKCIGSCKKNLLLDDYEINIIKNSLILYGRVRDLLIR